ncbi:unnamed protein product, partial [Polarella glacialis]
MNLGDPSELEHATPEVGEHFHWPRSASSSSSQQPEGHVGLPEAAGADDVQPDQLNMMCEEETPLPLCPECHQVCVRCAGAFRARRATAASSGSSTWERVSQA